MVNVLRSVALTSLAVVLSSTSGYAQGAAVPSPRPFPGAAQPPATTAKPADPATTTAKPAPPVGLPAEPAPAAGVLAGAPVYPTADFIGSFDAGSGQRIYLYGTNTPYADIVTYYRNTLKNGGRELYRAPAMQQFDLGRFQENTMAYPPSVVVKDYGWNGSSGHLFVTGTTEKRFRTVIQIVPATGGQ